MTTYRKPLSSIENLQSPIVQRPQLKKATFNNAQQSSSKFNELYNIIDNFVSDAAMSLRAKALIQDLKSFSDNCQCPESRCNASARVMVPMKKNLELMTTSSFVIPMETRINEVSEDINEVDRLSGTAPSKTVNDQEYCNSEISKIYVRDENIFAIPSSSTLMNHNSCSDPNKIPIVRRSSRRASISASFALDSLQCGVTAKEKKLRQPRTKLLNLNPKIREAEEEKELFIDKSDTAVAPELTSESQGCPTSPNLVPLENCGIPTIHSSDAPFNANIEDHSTPSVNMKEVITSESHVDFESLLSCDEILSHEVEELSVATLKSSESSRQATLSRHNRIHKVIIEDIVIPAVEVSQLGCIGYSDCTANIRSQNISPKKRVLHRSEGYLKALHESTAFNEEESCKCDGNIIPFTTMSSILLSSSLGNPMESICIELAGGVNSSIEEENNHTNNLSDALVFISNIKSEGFLTNDDVEDIIPPASGTEEIAEAKVEVEATYTSSDTYSDTDTHTDTHPAESPSGDELIEITTHTEESADVSVPIDHDDIPPCAPTPTTPADAPKIIFSSPSNNKENFNSSDVTGVIVNMGPWVVDSTNEVQNTHEEDENLSSSGNEMLKCELREEVPISSPPRPLNCPSIEDSPTKSPTQLKEVENITQSPMPLDMNNNDNEEKSLLSLLAACYADDTEIRAEYILTAEGHKQTCSSRIGLGTDTFAGSPSPSSSSDIIGPVGIMIITTNEQKQHSVLGIPSLSSQITPTKVEKVDDKTVLDDVIIPIGCKTFDDIMRDSLSPIALENSLGMLIDSESSEISQYSLSSSTAKGFVCALLSFHICSHTEGSYSPTSSSQQFCVTVQRSSVVAAFSQLLSHLDASDKEIDIAIDSNVDIHGHTGIKRVHFCDVDGSSITTPSANTSHLPVLSAMHRLHALIDTIKTITSWYIEDVSAGHVIETRQDDSPLSGFMRYCKLLTTTAGAQRVCRSLQESLSVRTSVADLMVMASLMIEEITCTTQTHCEANDIGVYDGSHTQLRCRVAWMAAAVVRAQLRWILDPPPVPLTVRSDITYATSPFPRCTAYKVVHLEESRRKTSALGSIRMPTMRMSLSALVTQALKQIYDSFIAAADSLLVLVRGTTESYICQLLTSAVTAEYNSAECMGEQDVLEPLGFFEGLGGVQPQLALAGVRGAAFLHNLFSLPALQNCIAVEEILWDTIRETALHIGAQGVGEDKHLCLLSGGWRGLMNFTGRSFMSAETVSRCALHVRNLEGRRSSKACLSVSDDEAMLLYSCLVFDFPNVR